LHLVLGGGWVGEKRGQKGCGGGDDCQPRLKSGRPTSQTEGYLHTTEIIPSFCTSKVYLYM
jgi:hypothetical protein